MNIFEIRSLFLQSRWLVHPQALLAYASIFSDTYTGQNMSKTEKSAFSMGYMPDPEKETEVGVFSISGLMLTDGYWYRESGTRYIAAKMNEAIDSGISAIVIQLNTPGGAVDSVAHITQAIARAKSKNIPVVALAEKAMSAGYWVAAQTDYIMAFDQLSEVGSIGAMGRIVDYSKMYEEYGITEHNIYPPESEDKNKPYRMALQGDYSLIIEKELSPLAQAFQNAVRQGRGTKLNEEVDGLLSGANFFAKDVVGNLVDGFGTLQDAIMLAADMAQVRTLNI